MSKALSPSSVLTILNSLVILRILIAVMFTFRLSRIVGYSETREMMTITKSNLFQFTCQY